jgi:hypothetical protein
LVQIKFYNSNKVQKKVFVLSMLFFTFYCPGYSQGGKLENAKESLKSTHSNATFNSSTTKIKRTSVVSSSNNDDTNTSFFDLIFRDILWGIAKYTVYGVAIESSFEREGRMHSAKISNYPYKEAKYGNFIYTDAINYNITRFDVYNHFLIESKNLYGNDFGVDFRFLKRFALDVNYTTFLESIKGEKDSFNMFSTLLKYHRIRTQRFDVWFGLGFRHVFNDVNITRLLIGFGGEVFVTKPISLVASHKWATINSQSVRNTKLLLKYHFKNYRIAAGYAHYKLGVSKINAFSIGIEASF